MNPVLQQFISFYQQMDKQSLTRLQDIYHQDVEFYDPVHHIKGIQGLTGYFESLMENINTLDFTIEESSECDGQAFIQWSMGFQHPRLAKNSRIQVSGISHIKYDSRVFYHRDYFDVGAMLYEHVPFLGAIIRKIKSRLGN